MTMQLSAVVAMADKLPAIEIVEKWGRKTWCVGGHSVVWVRPLGKRDVERIAEAGQRVPGGDIVALTTENLDAKDALRSMELPGFFTIEHFNNYPAVLIELSLAQAKHVRAAISDAHRVASAKPPRAPAKTKAKTKRAAAGRPRSARTRAPARGRAAR
jgi:hypothetical protein